MDHKELLHAQSLHAIMKWFTTMLSKETVNGFSYVRQVHRNLEGLSPSNRAQNHPPVGKSVGFGTFFHTSSSSETSWKDRKLSTVKDQNGLLVSLFTWFNPLGDSEADRDDFSYSLKSLFKTVYQTGNRDTNGLIKQYNSVCNFYIILYVFLMQYPLSTWGDFSRDCICSSNFLRVASAFWLESSFSMGQNCPAFILVG